MQRMLIRLVPRPMGLILGAVFLTSGLMKLNQPYDFLSTVYSYSLVSADVGYFVALTVPWIEFVIGVCLIARIFEPGAFLVSGFLLAVFTFAKTSAVHRDLRIGCGCTVNSVGEIVGLGDVFKTFLLFLAAVAAYACSYILASRDMADTATPHATPAATSESARRASMTRGEFDRGGCLEFVRKLF